VHATYPIQPLNLLCLRVVPSVSVALLLSPKEPARGTRRTAIDSYARLDRQFTLLPRALECVERAQTLPPRDRVPALELSFVRLDILPRVLLPRRRAAATGRLRARETRSTARRLGMLAAERLPDVRVRVKLGEGRVAAVRLRLLRLEAAAVACRLGLCVTVLLLLLTGEACVLRLLWLLAVSGVVAGRLRELLLRLGLGDETRLSGLLDWALYLPGKPCLLVLLLLGVPILRLWLLLELWLELWRLAIGWLLRLGPAGVLGLRRWRGSGVEGGIACGHRGGVVYKRVVGDVCHRGRFQRSLAATAAIMMPN
jgi:hypothetical protein